MDQQAKGKTVVVTGGAGFIGSFVVDKLMKLGAKVIVLDNFSTGKRINLARWEGHENLLVIEADVADGLWAYLAHPVRHMGQATHIIHLAAQTSVVRSVRCPVGDMRTNYGSTVEVMEYARFNGVSRVVFSSSAAVYGDTETLPIQESAQCNPLSPYGLNKYASEKCLEYFSAVHDVPSTSFRFFNVYGPRQDPRSPYSGVISIFMLRALQQKDLVVFGSGGQTRDFVFVTDIAEGIVNACFNSKNKCEVMNLGTGKQASVLDLAKEILRQAGSKSSVCHADPRAGEILHSCADISRAEQYQDFKAQVSLTEGLHETLQWYRETQI